MKTLFKTLWIMVLALSSWSLAQAQVTLSITSPIGSGACHQLEKTYTFTATATPDADVVTYDSGDRITVSYNVKRITVKDLGHFSIVDGITRDNLQDFTNVTTATFKVNYLEHWRPTEMRLEIVAVVEKHTTKEEPDSNGNYKPPITTSRYEITPYPKSQFVFDVGRFLTDPQTILIDGVARTSFEVDPTKGCQDFNLDAGTVEGVDHYRWIVTPSQSLLSGPASAFTSSIEVRPVQGGSVRLELTQICDGPRTKGKTFNVTYPLTINTSKPVICYDNVPVRFSIPQPEPGVLVSWSFDQNLLQEVARTSNSIDLIATGNHQAFTTVWVTIGSFCGRFEYTKEIYIGAPSMPITDPSGVPTEPHTYQGFKSYQVVSNHSGEAITGYNWWVTPNNLNLFGHTTPSCIIEGTTPGYHNFYVQLSNACGVGPVGGGGLNVVDNSGGGGPINPKRLNSPNLAPAISSFSLQPNPASDQVRLNLLDAAGAVLKVTTLQVEVLDLNGKVVATGNQPQLDVSELTSGVYVVRIHSEGQWLTQKLVIE